MLKIEYEGGKVEIPDLDEITHNQYMDFIFDEKEFLNQSKDEDEVNWGNTEQIISAVSNLVDIPDDLDVYPPNGEGIDEYVSVWGIYNYLWTMIDSYDPEELPVPYFCEYKGSKYYITKDRARRQFKTDESLSTLEAIETQELQKEYESKINQLEEEDIDGAYRFTYDLRKMAVMLRKDGEKLPKKRTDRKRWIIERAKHFEQLPMTIVMDVTFFLTTICHDLLKSRYTQHFLSPKKSLRGTSKVTQKKQKSSERSSESGAK